jgi:hypothetical protein
MQYFNRNFEMSKAPACLNLTDMTFRNSVARAATVAMQRHSKHIFAATNAETTIEELYFMLVRVEMLQPGRFRARSQFIIRRWRED